MKHKVFILMQAVLVAAVIIITFLFYPRASIDLAGTKVSFNSINADVIIISNNNDFSNPRYVDINNSISFNLKPGKYYWKASNGIIESLGKEFKIDSKVGLDIIEKDENYKLKNAGDVKVNVTKTKDGGFVGYIILEPEESEEIEKDDSLYTGREDNNEI